MELELQFQKAQKLPENVLDWAFSLCKSNMEEIYNSAWGWNDTTKQEELTASEARFLVAYTRVGRPLLLCPDSKSLSSGSMCGHHVMGMCPIGFMQRLASTQPRAGLQEQWLLQSQVLTGPFAMSIARQAEFHIHGVV